MGLTRRQISRLKYIPDGNQPCNGKQVRTDTIARPDDIICAALDLGKRFTPTSDDFPRIPLHILKESEDWIALHKPSGMTLHPTHGHYYDTMIVQLDALFKEQGKACSLHTIGRLDKGHLRHPAVCQKSDRRGPAEPAARTRKAVQRIRRADPWYLP